MKKVFYYRYVILLFSLLFFSCEEKISKVDQVVSKSKAILLGEINQLDEVQLFWGVAGNLGEGTSHKAIQKGSLLLKDVNRKVSLPLSFSSKDKWQSDKISITPGSTYELNANTDGFSSSANVIVPEAIEVNNLTSQMIDGNVSLSLSIINPTDKEIFCTISLMQKEFYLSHQQESTSVQTISSVPILTRDMEVDNNKYNEFETPFKTIFLRIAANGSKELSFSSREFYFNGFSSEYAVWVKSVDMKYYNYLYRSAIQNQEYNDTTVKRIQLPTNVTNGIGIIGGCFKVVLPLRINTLDSKLVGKKDSNPKSI